MKRLVLGTILTIGVAAAALLIFRYPPAQPDARRPDPLGFTYEVPQADREAFVGDLLEEAPAAINYLVWLPSDYDPAGSYPLLVYLHGSTLETATLGEEVERFAAVMDLPATLHTRQAEFPWIVLMPQATSDEDSYADHVEFMDAVVQQVVDDYAVDEERIYLMGFSMGGSGVYSLASAYPERWAAAVVIAGYWPGVFSDATPCDLTAPLWIFHSELDRAVPIGLGREAERRFSACQKDFQYTEWLQLDHIQTAQRVHGMARVFRWMASQP